MSPRARTHKHTSGAFDAGDLIKQDKSEYHMEVFKLQTVEGTANQGHQDKAKQLNIVGFKSGNEFSSTGCLQPESAIEVLHEEIFDDKSDLDEEYTPEKAIMQSDFCYGKSLRHSQSDNESSSSSCRTQLLPNMPGKLQDGFEKHGIIKHVALSENDHLEAKALSVRLQNDLWHDNRTESSLVQILWRKIGQLAHREKEVERTLSMERIESLVSRVEEEVELEGMVEDMCSRFKAEGEFLDIERRERDWERERREVRLEEEVELLRNKVEMLEEEIRIAHIERDCALQKQAESHETIDNMKVSSGALEGQQISRSHSNPHTDDEKILTVVRPGHLELPAGGEETLLAALREMVCQTEEKAERDHRMLEESFRDEQKLWIENEQLLQNRISALERELNCMRDMLKEKESVISSERERRREYGLEFDRVLAFWREENSVHGATCERLKNLESTLAKQAERIKQLMTLYPAEETLVSGLLSELLMDVEKVDNEKLEVVSLSKEQQLFEHELVERWKSQRDLLEEERDKLQEKLQLTTEMARCNEVRMEKLWQEKEMNLMKQLSKLEALVSNDDVLWKQRSGTDLREKGSRVSEVATYKQALQEERDKVQVMMAEREQLMEEHTQAWSAVLEARQEELCALKSAQKKLGTLLTTSKKQLLDLKRQLARHRRGSSKDSSLEIDRIEENSGNVGVLCSYESDVNMSYSTAPKELSQADDGKEYCVDIEKLANDISNEIGRLFRELMQEQDRMERERTDVRIGTQQLKDERKELENKVAEALNLMEDMRQQIKAKEGQMEQERKQMELILNSKTDEAEHLKTLLKSKDHEAERTIQKFKEELNLIQKEVEKERKEREDVMDMHFTSRRKLLQEMKEKEARWEKEIDSMSQEIEQLRADIDDKNQLILKLKNEGSGLYGKRDLEWQDLIGKIAVFDKQIAEAMLAIQSLKEELTAKEKELQRARLERDSERKVAWIHEEVEAEDPHENSRIVKTEKEIDWSEREHLLSRDSEDLIKLLEAERADTADAMSILQGAVRELQWALKHPKGKGDVSSFELNREAQSFPIKGELVKVHTSHLVELDEYILDLKLKVEEAEKRARTAEVALAVNAVKEAAKNTGTASALVKIGNEWVASPGIRRCKIVSQGNEAMGSNLRNFQQDQRLSGVTLENAQLWDIGVSSPGQGTRSNDSSSGWMTVRGGIDDSFAMQDPLQQGPLTLAVSTPPPRGQRRWMVDAYWLENVRKEQTSLKQQLDIERQRVSVLKQLEVENRWMEAAIVQALEQKKDSDTRVLELEQKVALLESMITKKGVREKSLISSSFYRVDKS